MIINISKIPMKNICKAATLLVLNGFKMIVWAEHEWINEKLRPANLFYSVFRNGKWEERKQIFDSKVDSLFPGMVVNSEGIIYLTWAEGSASARRNIHYSEFINNKWKRKKAIYKSKGNSVNARIGIDENDMVHFVWSEKPSSTKYEIYHKSINMESTNNVSKSPKEASLHPAFYVRGSKLYSCWMQGKEKAWRIWFNESVDGKWKTPVRVSKNISGWWPSISVDSKENVHISFASLGRAYVIHRIDGKWRVPVKIGDGYKKAFSSIEVDKNDRLHVAFVKKYKGEFNIFYSKSDDDFYFDEPKQISNGENCVIPVIRTDNKHVHVIWNDKKDEKLKLGLNDIFYTKLEIPEVEPIPEPLPEPIPPEPEPDPPEPPEPEPEPEPTPEPEPEPPEPIPPEKPKTIWERIWEWLKKLFDF